MDEVLRFLIDRGAVWVLHERERHRPKAMLLSEELRQAFAPFFGADVLEGARFTVVPFIENPGFYRELAAMGQPAPLDFTVMQGITFVDTVLLSARYVGEEGMSTGLLFHELVHVVQYRQLGVAEFVRRYVQGWADNGYQYEAIPLEQDAYALQWRYEADPERAFSVEDEVARRLRMV